MQHIRVLQKTESFLAKPDLYPVDGTGSLPDFFL